MSYLRVFILSLLGFITPVGLSVALILIRSDAESRLAEKVSSTPRLVSLLEFQAQTDDTSEVEADSSESFTVVSQDDSLSPKDSSTFVVSFLLRFEALPGFGKRSNLISKYDRNSAAHAGWAVGVRRLATSVRPEVYVRGTDGSGGWLTFSDYQFKPGEWNHLSVVFRKADSVSVFAQTMSAPRNQVLKNGWVALGAGLQAGGDLEFLGGHSIASVPLPVDAMDLVLGAEKRGRASFRGNLAELLVASSAEFPVDIRKLPSVLEGGPREIKNRVSEGDIALWISDLGRDESRYARAVQLSQPGPS